MSNQTIRRVLWKHGYHGKVPRKKPFISESNRIKRLLFANEHVSKEEDYWDRVIWFNEMRINLFGSDGCNRVWRKGNNIFQHDNDPKHTAEIVETWLIWNVPQELKTPHQSTDLNPIEHLWPILKRRVRSGKVTSIPELKRVVAKEWQNITPEVCKKLVTCKCHYKCREFTEEAIRKLHTDFWKQPADVQGTFLMGLINIVNIQRRHDGDYDDPSSSRRQVSVTYCLPTNNSHVQVCSRSFKNMLGLSDKHVYTLTQKKKVGAKIFEDHRGKNPNSHLHKKKYTEVDKELIKSHIMSFPIEESHYSRHKSTKCYLSPDLNIHRIYRAFKILHPDSNIDHRFNRRVFKGEFPKLSFHRPRADRLKN
ncbi:hypothetical protein ANN_27333 [Periplaneta americana]|uniref:Transposase Tc1-like domain-containing protein n=1 Tax=Periplaneta americana TaxID=6978 RepID=A0ABQ8RXW2_PERAM|nr:hypothetical protein ANN_27333 [Periplaneta americana]